ncbi:hypothetical protein SAMN06309945_1724 [Okibacterium fritillariae]|uniref:Uncharacterized protein n=1 Tax=Okibacterium fritillariae TaxID=123320 RepID=A0A1T5JP21_9MICO|nr:hypothetical protein SAMN06309945_1724 [Okibacterium fritillariae]
MSGVRGARVIRRRFAARLLFRAPGSWQTRGVTDAFSHHEWLTVPDLVELLDLSQSRVRRLIEDRHLLAVRRDNILSVPAVFLRDNEPLHELRGTLFVLADSGFSDDEAMDWLLSEDESLGVSPIEALRSGRKTEVRRVAQALG